MSLDQESAHPAAPAESPEAPAQADGTMTTSQWLRLAVVVGLLVWLTWATGPYGLAIVVGIIAMIFLHELGHFVMAKRAGMKVTEFFLGFGPRVWSFRRGETEYGLKVVPAGAYVKIIGMHNAEEVDPADEDRTYREKSFGARIGVAVAGSAMHFLLAIVAIYVLLVGFGVRGGSITAPDLTTWRVSDITADSAADRAGLRPGDDIVALDGEPTPTFDTLRAMVLTRADEDVVLTVERDGARSQVPVTIGHRPDEKDAGFLGVGEELPVQRLSPLEGVPMAVCEFSTVSVESVRALGRFFTPAGISDFGRQVADANDTAPKGSSSAAPPATAASRASACRPWQSVPETDVPTAGSATASSAEPEGENRLLSLLGVFRIGRDLGETGGLAALILLFAMMNIFIGLFNMIPLLPFDGGHVAIAIYERIQEKRKHMRGRYFADVNKLLPLTYAVVALLGLIFVSTLYLDIANPLTVN